MPETSQPDRREFTVSEVNAYLKRLFEADSALKSVWIAGEASNVKLHASGHLYFSIKDANSQLRVAYFRFGRRARPPADGDALLVHGDVKVYERRGEYQLIADDFIKAGAGNLAAKFEELKKKLHGEGLFADEHKVPLPAVPRRIGIITSPSTAALRDVLNVLSRRAPYLEAVLFPASVQGEAAAPTIISALKAADRCPGVEVILLVRGGGSIEDLWCFNDEQLARALAQVERPVISGVGHEIDYTIVDFVADKRAPTPSAAAELAAPDVRDLAAAVDRSALALVAEARDVVAKRRDDVARLFDRRVVRDVVDALDSHGQGVDDLAGDMAQALAGAVQLGEGSALELLASRLAHRMARELAEVQAAQPRQEAALAQAAGRQLAEQGARLDALGRNLYAIDPEAPLRLGFALVWDEAKQLVRDASKVSPGARLKVDVKRGSFTARREPAESGSGDGI